MKVVEILNNAFNEDPNAIHALICNRVPCNEALANDEFIPVEVAQTLDGQYFQVGT